MMERALKITIFLLFIGILCRTSLADFESEKAIQILSLTKYGSVDGPYDLNLNILRQILEADDIKDHHVSVISINGAIRTGKSLMLNFYLRYLYAQYKKHDISDWIGENSNASEITGFKWRSGDEIETIGVWIWSEVFTHNYANGDKVAIILLDSEGIPDSDYRYNQGVPLFLSMLVSPVKCYNVNTYLRKNDVYYLKAMIRHASDGFKPSEGKPLESLLFIVRDWPYANETQEYGWQDQKFIFEKLIKNEEKPTEKNNIRDLIQTRFENVSAFLMPHPGLTVSKDKTFTGNLQQINPEFLKYVKELVPSLLAPEKLTFSRDSEGEIVRAGDLVNTMDLLATFSEIWDNE